MCSKIVWTDSEAFHVRVLNRTELRQGLFEGNRCWRCLVPTLPPELLLWSAKAIYGGNDEKYGHRESLVNKFYRLSDGAGNAWWRKDRRGMGWYISPKRTLWRKRRFLSQMLWLRNRHDHYRPCWKGPLRIDIIPQFENQCLIVKRSTKIVNNPELNKIMVKIL
mgnify:CR=1 FL=1